MFSSTPSSFSFAIRKNPGHHALISFFKKAQECICVFDKIEFEIIYALFKIVFATYLNVDHPEEISFARKLRKLGGDFQMRHEISDSGQTHKRFPNILCFLKLGKFGYIFCNIRRKGFVSLIARICCCLQRKVFLE